VTLAEPGSVDQRRAVVHVEAVGVEDPPGDGAADDLIEVVELAGDRVGVVEGDQPAPPLLGAVDPEALTCPCLRDQAAGRGEAADAVTLVEPYLRALAVREHIEAVVAVEVVQLEIRGLEASRYPPRRSEVVSIGEHDVDRRIAGVGRDDIEVTVAVEVTHLDRDQVAADHDRPGACQAAGDHGERALATAGDDGVDRVVAVEPAEPQALGAPFERERGPVGELARAAVLEHTQAGGLGGDEHDVEVTVAVDIAELRIGYTARDELVVALLRLLPRDRQAAPAGADEFTLAVAVEVTAHTLRAGEVQTLHAVLFATQQAETVAGPPWRVTAATGEEQSDPQVDRGCQRHGVSGPPRASCQDTRSLRLQPRPLDVALVVGSAAGLAASARSRANTCTRIGASQPRRVSW